MQHDFHQLGAAFSLPGTLIEALPYGTGHINDTYAAVYQQNGARRRYIHQRVNQQVFRDVPALMDNISRVTGHQHALLGAAGVDDPERRALTLLPCRDGQPFHVDPAGHYWRTYLFIEGARTYDRIESPGQARAAAAAFGRFQRDLTQMPGGRLHETIPQFHDTRSRFSALQRAIAADLHNRAAGARREIDAFLAREDAVDTILAAMRSGAVPERVTHNDTKLNNVMLDDTTGEGICVIDLDTVMPGSVLYDFGDMVRTATSPVAEDERDCDRVEMRMEMFLALVDGYLGAANAFLTDAERDLLAFSGRLITLENAMRFLTDHLAGDVYFKIHRPGHNLDRCRAQIALVASIEQQMARMEACVAERAGICAC
jgi:Ser/Thr protein kinase RdoA (MazF antagonist)